MKSVYYYAILMTAIALLLATAAAAGPAGAQLTPFAYGFPSIFQNSEVTAFSKDLVTATDFEAVNVDFGGCSGLYGGCGMGFGGFPTISQVSEQTYFAESMDYYHAEETSAFNCPFLGLGGPGWGGMAGLGGLCGPDGLPYGIC